MRCDAGGRGACRCGMCRRFLLRPWPGECPSSAARSATRHPRNADQERHDCGEPRQLDRQLHGAPRSRRPGVPRDAIPPPDWPRSFKNYATRNPTSARFWCCNRFTPSSPTIDRAGELNLVGYFPTQPLQIQFRLAFQRVGNGWMIDTVSITTNAGAASVANAAAFRSAARHSIFPGSTNRLSA